MALALHASNAASGLFSGGTMATVAKNESGSWTVKWRSHGQRRQKSFGPTSVDKRVATAFSEQCGMTAIGRSGNTPWRGFCDDFEREYLAMKAPSYAERVWGTVNHFTRLMNPPTVQSITSREVEGYLSGRFSEGIHNNTLKVEIKHLSTILGTARRWGLIDNVPVMPALKEERSVPSFVSREEFEAIYMGCSHAGRPGYPQCSPELWWRGLLLFMFLTGWRISQVLAVDWSEVSLDSDPPTIVSPASKNKGRRMELMPLSTTLADTLASRIHVPGSPFRHDGMSERSLYTEFGKIQEASGIKPENTRGKWYTFHDLRRGFATEQVGNLTPMELQTVMQHRSFTTTQRYIAMGSLSKQAVTHEKISVPNLGGV